jgi:hypothetical protein
VAVDICSSEEGSILEPVVEGGLPVVEIVCALLCQKKKKKK